MGDGPGDAGSSRHRLVRAVDASLKRLGTDHIDLLQLHAFDASTPIDEVLYTLDMLVRAGSTQSWPTISLGTGRPGQRGAQCVSHRRRVRCSVWNWLGASLLDPARWPLP